jgi:hypothetical protein
MTTAASQPWARAVLEKLAAAGVLRRATSNDPLAGWVQLTRICASVGPSWASSDVQPSWY